MGARLPSLREIVLELLVMLAVAVVLAALGPFDSFAIGGFAARLAYWLPATFIGYAIMRPTLLATTALGDRIDLPRNLAMLIGVIIAAAPLTLALLWWNGRELGSLPSFEDWLQFYANVVIVAAVITLLFALLEPQLASRRSEPTEEQTASPEAPEKSPFLGRLPPAIRDQLIALEMEDHYVRAHAPGTSVLVLLRMRDAVAELAGIDGERVHRSWWVRRDAVQRVAGDSRNLRIILTGGLEAPVARDRVADLRAAGWLEDPETRRDK